MFGRKYAYFTSFYKLNVKECYVSQQELLHFRNESPAENSRHFNGVILWKFYDFVCVHIRPNVDIKLN